MNYPLRITMRDMAPSPSLEEQIRGHAAKLETFCSSLLGCHVVVGMPHRHKSHGQHFHVRIELAVPGAELVVTRDPAEDANREDAHAAVEAAFDEAEHRLTNHVGRERSKRLREARRG